MKSVEKKLVYNNQLHSKVEGGAKSQVCPTLRLPPAQATAATTGQNIKNCVSAKRERGPRVPKRNGKYDK